LSELRSFFYCVLVTLRFSSGSIVTACYTAYSDCMTANKLQLQLALFVIIIYYLCRFHLIVKITRMSVSVLDKLELNFVFFVL